MLMYSMLLSYNVSLDQKCGFIRPEVWFLGEVWFYSVISLAAIPYYVTNNPGKGWHDMSRPLVGTNYYYYYYYYYYYCQFRDG